LDDPSRNTRGTAAVAGLVLLMDWITKAMAHLLLSECTDPMARCAGVDLPGPVSLLRVENAGSALGFLPGLWVWTVAAVLGLLLVRFIQHRGGSGSLPRLATGLLLGGAVGNFVERLLLGGVSDFIDLGSVIINVADLALLGGTVLATVALHRASTHMAQSASLQNR